MGIAKKINKGGYNFAYVNICKYTYSPIILSYLSIPKIYCVRDLLNAGKTRGKKYYKTFSGSKSTYIDKIDPFKYIKEYCIKRQQS